MHGAIKQLLLALLWTVAISCSAEGGAFTLTTEAAVPNGAVVTYDPADGYLSYDGNGVLISTIELISSARLFDWSRVNAGVVGPVDPTSAKFFRLNTAGDESVDIGPVLPAGLTAEFLLADMQVDGSIRPTGKLTDAPGGGPYLFVVPEPSTSIGALLGMVLTIASKSRRRSG